MPINWDINTLVHSPADISRWLLIAAGLGTDPTQSLGGAPQYVPTQPWPIYNASEPNAPDNCLTIHDTMGHEYGRAQPTGEMFYHPGIQIRIRAQDWATGWAKADALRVALAMQFYQAEVTIPAIAADGSYTGPNKVYIVNNFNNISQVLPAGKDKPGSYRSIFTINACVVVREIV